MDRAARPVPLPDPESVSDPDSGTDSGTGSGTDSGSGSGTGSGTDSGSGSGSGTDSATGSGSGSGSGTDSASAASAPPQKRRFTNQQIGLAIAVTILLSGMVYMWWTGSMNARSVRDWLDGLGPAAPFLFVCAFVAGSMVGLPGMAFVLGARLAFGPWGGFALAYGGGLLAVTVPFLGARGLRAKDAVPWRPKQKHAARAFAKIETHPFLAIVALRLILWFNSALTYALALSPIRTRDYVGACALSLAPVVAIACIVIDWFL